MKSIFKYYNNNNYSINTLNHVYSQILPIKQNKYKMSNQLRIMNTISIAFIIKSNTFSYFQLTGAIKRKKKALNFVGSVCVASDLSGIKIFVYTENHSPYNRFK
ncbi:hypothetical protein D3C80_116720 [compost metagenome]